MPQKPASTAAMRWIPIRSPSSTTDRTVTMIGLKKSTAVASASGTRDRASYIRKVQARRRRPRVSCRTGCDVRRKRVPVVAPSQAVITTVCTT